MPWPTSEDYPRRTGRSPDPLPATHQRLLNLYVGHRSGPQVPSTSELTTTRRRTIARLHTYVDLISEAMLDLISQGELEAAEVDEFLHKLRLARGAIQGMIAALEVRGEEGRPV